jgi:post-segregation antitoxin (ccd killing protein)
MLDIEERFKKKNKTTSKPGHSKIRANFTIDSELMFKYREYCKEHSINMSAKVEKLIKHFLDSTEVKY